MVLADAGFGGREETGGGVRGGEGGRGGRAKRF